MENEELKHQKDTIERFETVTKETPPSSTQEAHELLKKW